MKGTIGATPARPLVPRTVTAKVPKFAEDYAANILARRAPIPLNLTELGILGAGGTYTGGPVVGGIAALGGLVRRHLPAESAIALNELSRVLASRSAAPAIAGVESQISDLRGQLEAELLKRSSN